MSRYNSVSIVYDGTIDAYKFNFPYNKDLVEIIKKTIPSNMRSYDPTDNHAWFVSVGSEPKYADGLIALCRVYFPHATYFIYTKAQYDEANRFQTGTTNESNIDSIYLSFRRYAKDAGYDIDKNTPLGDAVKIYRKLAIKWHPDKNPENGPIMSEINSQWSVLKTEVFK